MNLRFVEAFVWVARLNSFTRAAEKLFLTQSAVSNRVAALEEEFGTLLLDRRNQGFRLTASGMRFLSYAHRFLELHHELKAELGAAGHQPFSLRLGGVETVLHTWLIPMLNHLKTAMPQIEFDLTIEMTPALNEQIRRGVHDLVFSVTPAAGDGIINETLQPLEMVFVGPASMAGRGRIAIAELFQYEIMTFQRGSQPHVALVEKLRLAGAGDKRVHTLTSISALARLAESGVGIASLPLAAARHLETNNEIVVLDTELELTPLPMFASYWDLPGAPAFKTAIDEALRFARNYKVDVGQRDLAT
jgi:DNA-binding transcriptional LysR family regulator